MSNQPDSPNGIQHILVAFIGMLILVYFAGMFLF
jgi:hypothetical protein